MGWWDRAKPGDKVVCVETCRFDEVDLEVIKGQVYTIKEVYVGKAEHIHERKIVEIVGLRIVECGGFHVFDVAHFRPVQTKSTEASMKALRKHLTGKTAEVV